MSTEVRREAPDERCRTPSLLELPVPTLDGVNELEDRFIRLLREDQHKSTLFYRYGDLCALDTIQVDLVPEMKGDSHRLVSRDRHFSLFQVSSFDISFTK